MQAELKNLSIKDILNLLVIIFFSYFLLSIISIPTLLSYEKAAMIGLNREGMDGSLFLSIILGIIFAVSIYLISRLLFKQTEISVFASLLLTVSSYVFINNFGEISDLILLLNGRIVEPTFGFEKIYQIVPLLPFSLISIYILYSEKKNKYLFVAIVGLISAFFMPLISIPIMAILTANGIEKIKRIKDRTLLSTIAGGVIAASISFIILGFSAFSLALSILIGIIIAIAIYTFENKHTLLYLLAITLIMISIIYGIAYRLTITRVDSETIEVSGWLKEIEGKVAFASIYGQNISNIVMVETARESNYKEAFVFLFTNRTPKFDYLILDTLILDKPKEYAEIANSTAMFEVFKFAGIENEGNRYYYIYLSAKNDYLLIPVDSSGNLVGDRVIINGVEESYFKLLLLNSTDKRFIRYIHPRSDVNKNIFKVLYPEQFRSADFEIKEVKRTNNSRFRLYQIISTK
ncbi:MAG: hypothetical protein NZ903_01235 [Candidatus Micrarchaeota archaeon]|nr:hypothetical protein [Candidatus Micrarchaeota archaeon]